MKRKIVLPIVISIIIIFALYITGVFPIIINKSEKPLGIIIDSKQLTKGDIVNPISHFKFKEGTVVYLYTAWSDFNDLPDGISKYKVLYTDDLALIKKLQKNFVFTYEEADTTCESEICIKIDGKTVFKSDIWISANRIGLQNSKLGWVESAKRDSLTNIFKQLKPVLSPVVSL